MLLIVFVRVSLLSFDLDLGVVELAIATLINTSKALGVKTEQSKDFGRIR